ncbi:gluconate 2-dehydrogenase subunit 3 family protein [Marinimicrobium sp. C2-29]|uniref:gluconate 2-dehydrogenase subunit 3 family protein n=1 Tax=Marinimicrobium sp. C2-29 TaxID=3139825 RepID=UPI003139B52C
MNRRQALHTMMGALGLASATQVFGATAFLGGALPAAVRPVLADKELAVLSELGETILPKTEDSPGAKAAGIAAFMQTMVSGYYTATEQQIFLEGLARLQDQCGIQFSTTVLLLTPGQREQFLLSLEKDNEATYYRMIKQLTVWGYFSSETGVKTALRFAPIPGHYNGDVSIKPGTRAWANLLS